MSQFDNQVIIVEPDYYLANLYWTVIDRMANFSVIAVYGNMDEASKKTSSSFSGIVLVGLATDGDGTQGLQNLHNKLGRAEIAVVTNSKQSDWIQSIVGLGVSGIVLSSRKITDVEKVLIAIDNNESYLSPEIVKEFVMVNKKNLSSPLTVREVEVLRLMSLGLTYSMIAKHLNISNETSRSHMKNIYAKLSVSSKAEAISKALDQNII